MSTYSQCHISVSSRVYMSHHVLSHHCVSFLTFLTFLCHLPVQSGGSCIDFPSLTVNGPFLTGAPGFHVPPDRILPPQITVWYIRIFNFVGTFLSQITPLHSVSEFILEIIRIIKCFYFKLGKHLDNFFINLLINYRSNAVSTVLHESTDEYQLSL